MKVIIAGSRDLIPTLEEIDCHVHKSRYDITEVVCGGAGGVDTCGRLWAESLGIPEND